MLFSEVKSSPLLYLHNLLKRTYVSLYDRNIIGSSSAIFGNFQKVFRNDCLAFGQLLENL